MYLTAAGLAISDEKITKQKTVLHHLVEWPWCKMQRSNSSTDVWRPRFIGEARKISLTVARCWYCLQQTVKQQAATFIFSQHCAWIIYEESHKVSRGGKLGYHTLQLNRVGVCCSTEKWAHHRRPHYRINPLLIINQSSNRLIQKGGGGWAFLQLKQKENNKEELQASVHAQTEPVHAVRTNSACYALLNFGTLLVKA